MSTPITPTRTYIIVFVGLLALASTTIALSFVNLGIFNLVFALLIAGCKALLIIVFFMEARRSSKVIWIVAGAGFFWLGILLILSVGDYFTRGWVPGTGQ
jgi:cytochrome c oxidase subunit IV